MGVTRVSLGVQDLEPAVQEAIGRVQSYEETEDCAAKARALGVGSLNLDLIYGLPLQTEESVARTARRALDLNADRVAVFGYAHVPWMKKHQALIPEETLPGPLERFAQQHAIHRVLTEEGGYVADRPRPLRAARRRDGRGGGDAQAARARSRATPPTRAPALIGFGASAIGSLPQGYVQNAPTALAYGKAIEAGGPGDRARRRADGRRPAAARRDRAADVRPRGRPRRARRARMAPIPAPLLAALAGLAPFEADGLAALGRRAADVTEEGRPFVRSVAALFDAYLGQATTARAIRARSTGRRALVLSRRGRRCRIAAGRLSCAMRLITRP